MYGCLDIDSKHQRLHSLKINDDMSFYDFIRIYTYNDLINYQSYLNIPISFIVEHPDLKWKYHFIAETIMPCDFFYYTEFRERLLREVLKSLSINPYLPLSFIKKHMDLKWDWSYISRFNLTFQEKDLLELNHLLDFTQLSQNHSILLEWVLNYPKKWITNDQSFIHFYFLNQIQPWDYGLISRRLTYIELKRLYLHNQSLISWYDVSVFNRYITSEMIAQHPDYPWDYVNYQHPTIEFILLHPENQNLYNSIQITDNDLVSHNIPINIEKFLHSTKYRDQYRLYYKYKKLYQQIIQEICYY